MKTKAPDSQRPSNAYRAARPVALEVVAPESASSLVVSLLVLLAGAAIVLGATLGIAASLAA